MARIESATSKFFRVDGPFSGKTIGTRRAYMIWHAPSVRPLFVINTKRNALRAVAAFEREIPVDLLRLPVLVPHVPRWCEAILGRMQ